VRLSEIIEGIEGCATLDELQGKLQSAVENYGFSAFNFIDAGRPHLDEPFYFGTTGNAWESEYRSNSFLHVDPAMSQARRTNIPFPWSSIPLPPRAGKRKPAAHSLMDAARDHGFTNGYVFPFHFVDYQGRSYSTVNALFWKDDAARLAFLLSTEKRHELDLILLYWTQRAIDIAGEAYRGKAAFTDIPDNQTGPVLLTDREREVLTWAGRGLTVAHTSGVLKIGEETVQTHIRHAIEKLSAANKTHAVAKAFRMGLVDL